jgi:ppGpp synthetase/RelA/SpoT-type nucleotidyltranferase
MKDQITSIVDLHYSRKNINEAKDKPSNKNTHPAKTSHKSYHYIFNTPLEIVNIFKKP